MLHENIRHGRKECRPPSGGRHDGSLDGADGLPILLVVAEFLESHLFGDILLEIGLVDFGDGQSLCLKLATSAFSLASIVLVVRSAACCITSLKIALSFSDRLAHSVFEITVFK